MDAWRIIAIYRAHVAVFRHVKGLTTRFAPVPYTGAAEQASTTLLYTRASASTQ